MAKKRVGRVRETARVYGRSDQVVSATEFKARCLELIDRIQQTHTEVTVTRYGKPVAKLVPIEAAKQSAWGWMREWGEVEFGDIVSPTGEVWEANE